MKKDNVPSEPSDIWTLLFNGLAEAIKMFVSIIVAIVDAGSKTTHSLDTSAEEKALHAGDRHNNDKTVHFDNDA